MVIFPRRTTTCSSILLPLLPAILTLALWAAPALAKQGGAVVRVSADPYSDPAGQHPTEVEPDSFATKLDRGSGGFRWGGVSPGGEDDQYRLGDTASRRGKTTSPAASCPGRPR